MKKPKRSSGRPSSSERKDVSSASILQAALRLSRKTPLQDISIAAIARSMEITPALIHYYIGGRDWLISGVMNSFYQELTHKWPVATGAWQDDLLAASRTVYDHFVRYGGIASYAASDSRFSVFQLEGVENGDYGLQLLEKFTARVRAAGLSGARTGIYAHLMMNFIINTAHGTSRHLFPGEHRAFLQKETAKLDKNAFPSIFFAMQAPLNLDGDIAFQEGFDLFLLGMQAEAGRNGNQQRP
jgi:AcrR family transcriptional regulator